MSESKPPKRSLKLLPEVLPAPISVASSTRATTPRERTMHHMKRLVAATAMLGAASGPACSKPEGVAPPPDVPPQGKGTPNASASSAETAPPPPTSATPPVVASATTHASNVPPPPPTYAVVDPMPPPARCNISTVSTTAKWIKEGSTVEVVVASVSASVRLRPPKDSPLSAVGGKVTSSDFRDGKVHAQIALDPNVDLVVLSVPASCPGWATLAVKLAIAKGPGRKITTTVDNY